MITEGFEESAQEFFEAASKGKFLMTRCLQCEQAYFPPVDVCPKDLCSSFTSFEGSGLGEVYTYAIMHHVYAPKYAEKVPYNIAVIQLDEGPRFGFNLTDISADEIAIGLRVEAIFEEVDGVHLPYFKPVAGSR